MSGYSLGRNSTKHLIGVNPILINVILLALSISKVDFGIPKDGGRRTPEHQNALFNLGITPVNGYDDISEHQSGNAFDIFAYVNGKASYKHKDLLWCSAAILQAASVLGVKIKWGGHFTTYLDMPHFELA